MLPNVNMAVMRVKLSLPTGYVARLSSWRPGMLTHVNGERQGGLIGLALPGMARAVTDCGIGT